MCFGLLFFIMLYINVRLKPAQAAQTLVATSNKQSNAKLMRVSQIAFFSTNWLIP